jgi:lauroyl/myristoyl acyltransferase
MIGWGFFHLLRALERVLPAVWLRALLWPPIAVATAWELLGPRQLLREFYRLPASVRPSLPPAAWAWRIWRRRVRLNLARLIWLWPDRLQTTRWQKGCRCTGLEQLERLRAEGRPVVLAMLHFGPVPVLRYWMRAQGLPVASLATRPPTWGAPFRAYLDRLSDQASGLMGVAHVFNTTQLKSMCRFLEGGQMLLIAVDGEAGRQQQVPGTDYGFIMAPGAIRLAARRQAVVVPCLIRAEPAWGVTIQVGDPVPQEWVAQKAWHAASCAHLLRAFRSMIHDEPEQCSSELLSHFRAVVPARVAAVKKVPGTVL